MKYRYPEEENRDIKRFESRFQAHVAESREYRQSVCAPMYYGARPDTAMYNIEHKVEPLIAIHLPREQFDRLMDEQIRMDSWRDEAEYAKRVLTNLRKDEQVCAENPAVAKAYRNYQLLLELAR
jgi:hypothetical protein